MAPRSLLRRLTGSLPVRVGMEYGNVQAGNYAAGLAFNAFMAMFPLILGVLAVVGLAIGDIATRASVETALLSFFPEDAQTSIGTTLDSVHASAGLLGIISILGLIWTGTNFFAALEFALDTMFGCKQRPFLRQRLMGVVMLVVLIAAVVVSVGANSLMNLVPFMAALGPVTAALSMIILMLLIYRFVPNRSFRLSEVWQGAVIAGILIEIITLAFPIYGKLVHGFNSYGAQFALFFLLATWLAFLSQFILLGAVWNRVSSGVACTPMTAPAKEEAGRRGNATVPEPASAKPAARSRERRPG